MKRRNVLATGATLISAILYTRVPLVVSQVMFAICLMLAFQAAWSHLDDE